MVSVNISVPWQLPMVFVDGSCVSFDFESLLDPAMQSIRMHCRSATTLVCMH